MQTKNAIMRTGVYGVVTNSKEILLIKQPIGIYENILDLPGGGIEFGETIEEALRREFIEELNGTFMTMTHFDNITSLNYYSETELKKAHTFHRIGLVYLIDGFIQSEDLSNTLKHTWYKLEDITKDNATPFAFEIAQKLLM